MMKLKTLRMGHVSTSTLFEENARSEIHTCDNDSLWNEFFKKNKKASEHKKEGAKLLYTTDFAEDLEHFWLEVVVLKEGLQFRFEERVAAPGAEHVLG